MERFAFLHLRSVHARGRHVARGMGWGGIVGAMVGALAWALGLGDDAVIIVSLTAVAGVVLGGFAGAPRWRGAPRWMDPPRRRWKGE